MTRKSSLFAAACIMLAFALFAVGCVGPVVNPATTDAPVTDEVTAEPSGDPSASPEASDAPSTEIPTTDVPVSENPTEAVASDDPTAVPTGDASTAPTTDKPSDKPTATPTAAPTATPKPTAAPTAVPTATPKPADIPPFSSPAINGGQTVTNSIFGTCKVTMVNVWATTCGPCIQEMPHIQQLANNYASRGLKVISVLGDSETPGCIQTALGIINGINFTIPVLRNNASVAAAFPAGAYPTTYFIDSNGNILRVVTSSNSYDGWCKIVDGLL